MGAFKDYLGNVIDMNDDCWVIHNGDNSIHYVGTNDGSSFESEYYQKTWTWFKHEKDAMNFRRLGEDAFIGLEF
jgi:hypothetical protein